MRVAVGALLLALSTASAKADETAVVYSAEIEGDRVFGYLIVRDLGGISIDWFQPCPPREQGYPKVDLVLEEENRPDCPNTSAPIRQQQFDHFSGDSPTLEALQTRGRLNCGVGINTPGFATVDTDGQWQGLDVSFCRAVAAAVLGDSDAVEFVPTTPRTRFTALASGEVDILARSTTWTFSRDTALRYDFVGVNYYDGQGFMVPKELGVTSAAELDGATICVQPNTTSELNLADYFSENRIDYEPVFSETSAEAVQQYLAGECDVYTADMSELAGIRAEFDKRDGHIILPEVISKEPLGPLVRQGDAQWSDIVRWTLNALVSAEELGITSANVRDLAEQTANPEIARLLGAEGNLGEALGLSKDWAANVIASIGNYGEIYSRHLGENTPVGLARGLNAQWSDGGLLYAPPFR